VPDNEIESAYPEMAAFFDSNGEYSDYDWEAHEVVTDSGTIKTLFHLLPANGTPSKGKTVLMVNGAMTNAMMWLENITLTDYADGVLMTKEEKQTQMLVELNDFIEE